MSTSRKRARHLPTCRPRALRSSASPPAAEPPGSAPQTLRRSRPRVGGSAGDRPDLREVPALEAVPVDPEEEARDAVAERDARGGVVRELQQEPPALGRGSGVL